jgi:hypothetical protein
MSMPINSESSQVREMLKLVQEIADQMVPYDDAVAEGKKIMSEIEDRTWHLGDLADRAEPRYGDQTLIRLAADIGVNARTLKSCRSVARAWPEKDRIRSISFETAKALMGQPDRGNIVRDNPQMTLTQARKLAHDRNGDAIQEEEVFPYQEPCTDCNTAQEQWQRSLGNMLGDILSFRSYWDHLFGPEWNQYKIPSSHLTLATQAKKEFISLVASLKEHAHDEEN